MILTRHRQIVNGEVVCRYKDNIKPMDKASEAILALNPVIPSVTKKSWIPIKFRSLG